MSDSEQQTEATQSSSAVDSNKKKDIDKKKEFTQQLYAYLEKSPDMTANDAIEKRGLNKIQINHIIDLLVNSRKNEKNYYKFK